MPTKPTRFEQESAAQAGSTKDVSLREVLESLDSPYSTDMQRWYAVKIILCQLMLAQGVDINHKFTTEFR